MLNGSGNSRHLCLVPDLRRNASRFSLLRILLTVSLSHMIYIMWMYIPFMLILLRVFFYHKWIMNFVTIYSAFIEMIRWFLFFIFECGRSCWLIWRYQIHHLKNKTSNHIYLWDKSHLITWYDPSIYLFILFFNFTIFYWSF